MFISGANLQESKLAPRFAGAQLGRHRDGRARERLGEVIQGLESSAQSHCFFSSSNSRGAHEDDGRLRQARELRSRDGTDDAVRVREEQLDRVVLGDWRFEQTSACELSSTNTRQLTQLDLVAELVGHVRRVGARRDALAHKGGPQRKGVFDLGSRISISCVLARPEMPCAPRCHCRRRQRRRGRCRSRPGMHVR